jgi:hypothetical protein
MARAQHTSSKSPLHQWGKLHQSERIRNLRPGAANPRSEFFLRAAEIIE